MNAPGETAVAEAAGYRSREEAREVLDRTFEAVEGDMKLAPVLRATGLHERLRLSDLDLTVDLAAGSGDRCLEWTFDDQPALESKISLTMESTVANSMLQGAESIGVAIARRRIRIEGDADAALVHLPATRLICGHYLRLIEREYPHLVIARKREPRFP